MIELPIDLIKNDITTAIANYSNLILKASPGSGKTTRIPLYLLKQTSKKIYILEPRRLAAKLAAIQVAKSLGEAVGQTVGYIFRMERMTSVNTRIFFLTEGTFLKILNEKKDLSDVEVVILDEFHERHLSTDAALSFLIKIKNDLRPDLKLIVMSATIETKKLEVFLAQAGSTFSIEQQAHRYKLTQHFLPNITSVIGAALEKKIRSCLESIIEQNLLGDILVFLPGMKEIKDTQKLIEYFCHDNGIDIFILHGDLDTNQQDHVLMPTNSRKIILSTNIAESSVTISGISIVIDSGLARESSYNFFSGLPELKTIKISQASAIQRSGRANRQKDGHCFRLYAELDFLQRPSFLVAEIERSDLSELLLKSLSLFNLKLEDLPWLDQPKIASIKNSTDLLFSLNAMTINFELTSIGRKMISYDLHPRFARSLVAAENTSQDTFRQLLEFICDLIGEKQKARFLKKYFPTNPMFNPNTTTSVEQLLLMGFPDRIARSRGHKHFEVITKNGETLKISKDLANTFNPNQLLWIVLDVDNANQVQAILPIQEDWLYDLIPLPLTETNEIIFDEKKCHFIKKEKIQIGTIILSENVKMANSPNPEIRKALFDLRILYLKFLESDQKYKRLITLNKCHLNQSIENCLSDFLATYTSDDISFNDSNKEQLKEDFFYYLYQNFDPEGQFELEKDFPLYIGLSDRRKIPINYELSQTPWIESYIQDFYGLSQTPVLARGKILMTLRLLGPHKRALQVTQDLKSFWENTYPQMLKELMREYPRHHWPNRPESARPVLLKRMLTSS